jgi:hypothetical protein
LRIFERTLRRTPRRPTHTWPVRPMATRSGRCLERSAPLSPLRFASRGRRLPRHLGPDRPRPAAPGSGAFFVPAATASILLGMDADGR